MKKTKFLDTSKYNIVRIYVKKVIQKQTEKVSYPDCNLNKNWDHSQEIKISIEIPKNTFNLMRKVLP